MRVKLDTVVSDLSHTCCHNILNTAKISELVKNFMYHSSFLHSQWFNSFTFIPCQEKLSALQCN